MKVLLTACTAIACAATQVTLPEGSSMGSAPVRDAAAAHVEPTVRAPSAATRPPAPRPAVNRGSS